MPHINAHSDVDDRCTCGHVRGEHLKPGGGWHTAYCLIVGCHCGWFQDGTGDGSGRPPRKNDPARGKEATLLRLPSPTQD
jgi:hypothetical protein